MAKRLELFSNASKDPLGIKDKDKSSNVNAPIDVGEEYSNQNSGVLAIDPLAIEDMDKSMNQNVPFSFSSKIKNTAILTPKEKKEFRMMSKDELVQIAEVCPADSLGLQKCRFGLGVFAKQNLATNTLLGYYGGKLVRKLPEDAIYSFDVTVIKKTPLFLNAESVCDRSILA